MMGFPLIPKKNKEVFHFSESKAREVVLFKNRYMTYIIENNTVVAASFDFI
jgi:hypothetical protein